MNTFDSDFFDAYRCSSSSCGTSYSHAEAGVVLTWNDPGSAVAEFALGGLDASGHRYLSFRVVSRSHIFNSGRSTMDLRLRVTGPGGRFDQRMRNVQIVPHLYNAHDPFELFQTVRIPVSKIAAAGVDVMALDSFEVRVPAPDRSDGSIVLSHIELAE